MGEGLKRAATAARLSQGKGKFIRKRDGEEVRVMAVVEGWVVARVKGAVPFLAIQKDFLRDFEITPLTEAQDDA